MSLVWAVLDGVKLVIQFTKALPVVNVNEVQYSKQIWNQNNFKSNQEQYRQ